MLSAIAADFAAIPDLHVVTLLDERLTEWALDPNVEIIRVDSQSEPAAFRETASQSDYALVIAPEIDGILHHRCMAASEAGAKLLGPSPDAVALTSDKLALERHWRAAGVPTPATLPRTEESPPFPPPWIVKPRWGAGSQGIELIHPHLHPLSRKAGRGEKNLFLPSPGFAAEGMEVKAEFDTIIQPLLAGRPASVAFLIGPNQTIALPPCWQHLDEHMHYLGGSVPIPNDSSGRARSIAAAAVSCVPGLFGYVGVDVLLGEQDMAIEINPRLTTSYIGLRQLANENLADAMLQVVRGESVDLTWRDDPVSFGVPR